MEGLESTDELPAAVLGDSRRPGLSSSCQPSWLFQSLVLAKLRLDAAADGCFVTSKGI